MANIVIVGFPQPVGEALRILIEHIVADMGKTADSITTLASAETKWCGKNERAPYIIVRHTNEGIAESIGTACANKLNLDVECEKLTMFIPAPRPGPPKPCAELAGILDFPTSVIEPLPTEDEQMLTRAVARIAVTTMRTRVKGIFEAEGITKLSQFRDRPCWLIPWQGFGEGCIHELAMALEAEGVKCRFVDTYFKRE